MYCCVSVLTLFIFFFPQTANYTVRNRQQLKHFSARLNMLSSLIITFTSEKNPLQYLGTTLWPQVKRTYYTWQHNFLHCHQHLINIQLPRDCFWHQTHSNLSLQLDKSAPREQKKAGTFFNLTFGNQMLLNLISSSINQLVNLFHCHGGLAWC